MDADYDMDADCTRHRQSAFQNPFTVINILEYLPHGEIIQCYRRINKYFNDAAQGLDLFYDYTLHLECGRRGSVIGRKGCFLPHGGRQTSKNAEVVIKDQKRSILISTSNAPLKSQRVASALTYICKSTAIHKVHFKSYRVSPDKLLMFTPDLGSPPHAEPDIFFTQLPQNLPDIQEEHSENTPSDGDEEQMLSGFEQENVDASSIANHIRPPPSPASFSTSSGRSVFSGLSSSGSRSDVTARTSSKRLLSPTPSSPSSTLCTIGTDVIELPFPPSHATQLSGGSDVGSARTSSGSVHQTGFVALLDILRNADITSLVIGEECIGWTWDTVMAALQRLRRVQHLAVNVGFQSDEMPSLCTEQQWLDFIGINHSKITQLRSVCSTDDCFLRYITSLAAHREVGNHLQWEPAARSVASAANTLQYEKGSLLRLDHRNEDAMRMEPEEDDDSEAILGHYVRAGGTTELRALEFVRYHSPPIEEGRFSGMEFEGAVVLELSPFDGMFITVPPSVVSFRISCSSVFYDEPDDFNVVIPYCSSIRQLCLHSIDNLRGIRSQCQLAKLEYLVIKTRPRDKDQLTRAVEKLCKSAPLKEVTLMFRSKESRRKTSSVKDDYWRSLREINVEHVKQKQALFAHPPRVMVVDEHVPPPDLSALNALCRFSDYVMAESVH